MHNKCKEILDKLQMEHSITISSYTFPPKQELKLKLKDMLEDEVDEKYYLSEKLIKCFNSNGTGNYPRGERFRQNIGKGTKNIGNSIITTEGNKATCNFIIVKEATKKGYKEAYDGDSVNLAYPDSETRRGRVGNQVAQTLQCNDNMGVVDKPKVIGGIGEKKSNKGTQWYQQDRIYDDKVAISVTTVCNPYYKNDLRIRKLTPKECFRLMGFDDEDFEKAALVNSNAQLYKQAGNSIYVGCLTAILTNLLNKY